MELLEERVEKFRKEYLADAGSSKPLELNEAGFSHLKSLLNETGYQEVRDNEGVYRRNNVDQSTNQSRVDLFDTFDVLKKASGFSYLSFTDLNEADEYLSSRSLRFEFFKHGYSSKRFSDYLGWSFTGLAVSGVLYICNEKAGGNIISNWWLLLPPLLGLSPLYDNFIERTANKGNEKKFDSFFGNYQNKLITGPEAVLKALKSGTE